MFGCSEALLRLGSRLDSSSAGVSGDVAPSQVCEQLKKMVKSSNPDLTKVAFFRSKESDVLP